MSRAPGPSPSKGWRARPSLALAVKVAAVAVVLLGAVVGLLAVEALVPGGVAWPLALLTRAVGVAVGVTAAASVSRRLLTLSRLLRLSLLFPDDLPSRFRTALRAGTPTRRLRQLPEGHPAEHVVTLAASIAAHDRDTRGHSERVRAYTEVIALRLGIDGPDIDRLRWASLLHDVGKLGIPTEVLTTSAQLDEEAWAMMRRHPEDGDRLAAPLRDHLGPYADTILHHHERYDGAGYPSGLSADQICLGARVVAVADAFEVMTGTSRRYRTPDSLVEAREELVRCSGTQFDPDVVRAFVTIPLDGLRRVVRAATYGLPIPLALAVDPVAGAFEHALPVGARLPDAGQRPDGSEADGEMQGQDGDVDVGLDDQ